MLALVNCDVFSGSEVIADKAIIIEGDRIVDLVAVSDVPSTAETVDLKGANVAPGFIDLQVNGGGGVLFNSDLSARAVETISFAHRQCGTTSFLPTIISASGKDMLCAINVVRKIRSDPTLGVLGLHLEGPYLNPEKAGVHDKAHTRKATVDEIKVLLAQSDDVVSLMTAAPEMLDEPTLDLLRKCGWRLAIGHSNAGYSLARTALESGFSCVTHLFNAMSQLGSREPGIVGAAFCDANTYASVIVDGFHVDYATLGIAKKLMGDRIFLVTDAMPPVGSDEDRFVLGPYQIERKDGRLVTSDGVLAGSCLDMASAVRNCIQHVGIPMPEALRMASLYPARAIGIDGEYGLIRRGYKADIVIFNNQIQVIGTVKSGRLSLQ